MHRCNYLTFKLHVIYETWTSFVYCAVRHLFVKLMTGAGGMAALRVLLSALWSAQSSIRKGSGSSETREIKSSPPNLSPLLCHFFLSVPLQPSSQMNSFSHWDRSFPLFWCARAALFVLSHPLLLLSPLHWTLLHFEERSLEFVSNKCFKTFQLCRYLAYTACCYSRPSCGSFWWYMGSGRILTWRSGTQMSITLSSPTQPHWLLLDDRRFSGPHIDTPLS